jgi:hypothetical protein
MAQYERRREEWRYQRTVAQFELSVANQQAVIATDRVQIATQERTVTELKTQLSEDTVEFLTNKQFVTEELLDWMAGILEGVYRSMLQQATTVARLAAAQLAFERQQEPPRFVQSDYWTAKSDLVAGVGEAPDRKGLTGSARLLNDVELLNQHALDTDKRKLHKTISLAQLAPLEFEQFRASGVLTVATPMSLFDQDFPGEYSLPTRVSMTGFLRRPPSASLCGERNIIGPESVPILPKRLSDWPLLAQSGHSSDHPARVLRVAELSKGHSDYFLMPAMTASTTIIQFDKVPVKRWATLERHQGNVR